MPNKEECLTAIDVVARYCNEVKQGHIPPRFELTNELDVLMQLIQGCFAKSKVVLDEPMTICQCCEYLATMIDDKELLKTIDYIEERATVMYNKLVERKAQVEKLQKRLNHAIDNIMIGFDGDTETRAYLGKKIKLAKDVTKEEWKEYFLNGIE